MSKSFTVRIVLVIVSVLLLMGCGMSSRLLSTHGNKYQYSISLTKPVSSEKLLFRDDRIMIQFRFDDPAIRFQIQNLSSDNMSIEWGSATLAIGGIPRPVRSLASFYDTTIASVPGGSVPPLAVVRDVIALRSGVTTRGREWLVADLLPTTDGNSFSREAAIRGTAGGELELVFPLKFGREHAEYRFRFVVDSVRRVEWGDYHRPSWLPPAPPVPILAPTFEDKVTAALIVGGFAGFFTFMATMKKTPIAE